MMLNMEVLAKRKKKYLSESIAISDFEQSVTFNIPGMSTMYFTVTKGAGKAPRKSTKRK